MMLEGEPRESRPGWAIREFTAHLLGILQLYVASLVAVTPLFSRVAFRRQGRIAVRDWMYT